MKCSCYHRRSLLSTRTALIGHRAGECQILNAPLQDLNQRLGVKDRTLPRLLRGHVNALAKKVNARTPLSTLVLTAFRCQQVDFKGRVDIREPGKSQAQIPQTCQYFSSVDRHIISELCCSQFYQGSPKVQKELSRSSMRTYCIHV